ncbi:TIR domain-containing protein [Streptomyces griseocarneus]|nr:TIR domain-containing protein [Streptomyces griseocarneus]
MHEIFINYRTASGGKETAYIFDDLLSRRFGEDSIFRATKSIDIGAEYHDVLINGVRRSSVLLALIGPHWIDAPDQNRPERRALAGRTDWVRREIEEAFAYGVLVVPVLIGRGMEQLDGRRLPASLTKLAACQYERYSQRSAKSDIARLGDRLVKQVPRLAALDTQLPAAEAGKAQNGTSVHNSGQQGGIGNVQGSVGTYVNDTHAPLHTGSGSQFNGTQIHGDGTNYIAGDNSGDIRQQFGLRRNEDDGQ